MLARTYTATMLGLTPLKIEVEVDGNRGTPHFILIGLASKATGEAKERITAALQNCGIRIRSKRTVVNLAPADVPKTGSAFDLAIAVGLLKMYGEVKYETEGTLFLGELALDGQLKPIRGALPLTLAAKDMDFQRVILPAANQPEVATINTIDLHPVSHLKELLSPINLTHLPRLTPVPYQPTPIEHELTFADVIGQDQAKRALVIAAAGGHHVLLNGSPGAGKSMLAKAFTSILPPLTERETIEVTRIYSVCGLNDTGLITSRPFRAPHHSTSAVGLLGGGSQLRPGEITLAHRGILFMDEFLEFSSPALEALRQPLEDKKILISRANGSIEYPAHFILLAATNPCPCGYALSALKTCSCPPQTRKSYEKKLSGPLLDRFDMKVVIREVDREKLKQGSGAEPAPTANDYTELIRQARVRQYRRLKATPWLTNSEVPPKYMPQFFEIDEQAKKLAGQHLHTHQLSARGYFKLLKLARTMADVEGSKKVQSEHIAEAKTYLRSTIKA